jgi:hypothetical protein
MNRGRRAGRRFGRRRQQFYALVYYSRRSVYGTYLEQLLTRVHSNTIILNKNNASIEGIEPYALVS